MLFAFFVMALGWGKIVIRKRRIFMASKFQLENISGIFRIILLDVSEGFPIFVSVFNGYFFSFTLIWLGIKERGKQKKKRKINTGERKNQ